MFQVEIKLVERTFQEIVEDIFADDKYGVVLAIHKLQRGEKSYEYSTIHLWKIKNDKFIEFRECPYDLFEFDKAWS